MPRHPPFALDNLTTENKMLASTVQFSTNDQPTTRSAQHQRHLVADMKDQAVPGIEKQPPSSARVHRPQPGWLFFQIPNRVLIASTSRTRTRSFALRRVLEDPGRCRLELTSVSAFEHPTIAFGRCGLLDRFPDLVAP